MKDGMDQMKNDVKEQSERMDAIDRKMCTTAQEHAAELAQMVEHQLTTSLTNRFENVEQDLAALQQRAAAPDAGGPGGQAARPPRAVRARTPQTERKYGLVASRARYSSEC